MLRGSRGMGMDDGLFFPDISDERSGYSSPLTDILKELRRKHAVAAAATTGPHMSLTDSSQAENDDPVGNTCMCQSQRRGWVGLGSSRRSSLFGGAGFGREDSALHQNEPKPQGGICPLCDKKEAFDPIGAVVMASQKPFRRRISGAAVNRLELALKPPQNAEALIQSTPHLRHLSPASLDMQGAGNLAASRGILGFVLPSSKAPSTAPTNPLEPSLALDYSTCLARNRANQQAATELASFLWVLAHEMSLEDYLAVENEVFTSIFALLHAHDNDRRMAGVTALDALMDAPSADEEKKAIKFAGALSSGLRAPHPDYNFLSAVAKALGHLATRGTNVDSVEAEVTRALEWLRSERSDRRLAACLTLKELAINSPTAFYSKTSASRSSQTSLGHGGSNEFLDHIFPVIRDPQPIVRACAADALSMSLKIVVERLHLSLTALLCQVHFAVMDGLEYDPTKKRGVSAQALLKAEATHHGSLLVVASMLEYTRDFMLPRFDEVCSAVLKFADHPKALIRLEVIRLIPRLARRCPGVFGRRYLEGGLLFLLKSATTATSTRVGVDVRPAAFESLGQLILAMNDDRSGAVIGGAATPTVKILNNPDKGESAPTHIIELSKTGIIYDKLDEIFALVQSGLRITRHGTGSRGHGADTRVAALNCGADLVEALGHLADPYIDGLINDMFGSGLSEDLIHCLHAIAVCVPSQQRVIEDRLLQEVSLCLAGTPSAEAICQPLAAFQPATRTPMASSTARPRTRSFGTTVDPAIDGGTDIPKVTINMSDKPEAVTNLVLSLRTLSSFGDNDGKVTTSGAVVPLLPFVRHVAAHYLTHPSSEVRRAASLTCCILLVPTETNTVGISAADSSQDAAPRIVLERRLGSASGRIIEEVLGMILGVAVFDPSPVVRLCVVRALDARFDSFLCQAHHLKVLMLLLQDEALATRAAGLKLLGRLTRLNPAPVLPIMRQYLVNLIIELRCGGDTGRGREEATRLLNVFLQAEPLQRLVRPVLPSIVDALPLQGVAPRLASAALEALGELARASRVSLKPWVKQLVPHILETMQDQSSASKQRTSLKTLGRIAGCTGYVIRPYLDYPQLLSQATDVLPGTKRAPWALRREVIRTLGILGALDPDQYHTFVPKSRKGGAVGGGYFIEQDELVVTVRDGATQHSRIAPVAATSRIGFESTSLAAPPAKVIASKEKASNMRSVSGASLLDTGSNVKEADDDLPAHLYMYEQYAMVAQPVSDLPPERRTSPSDEDFYPTVTIQALTRIFKDSSLAVHHGMVIQALMFIFQSLGLRCVPYLVKVVPHMIATIKTCGQSTLREALLKQVATLSGIVKEHLRPYVIDIFDIVDDFWSSRHLGTILTLVSKIAIGVPDEFRKYVPRLVRKVLASLEEIQVSDWLMPYSRSDAPGSPSLEVEKLELILRSVRSLRDVLGDFLHLLVPAFLKLADSLVTPLANASGGHVVIQSTLSDIAVMTFQTLSALLGHDGSVSGSRALAVRWEDHSSGSWAQGSSLPARAAQPLVRMLGKEANANRVVGLAIIETLCVCSCRLGRKQWLSLYHDVARTAIFDWQKRHGHEVVNPSTANCSSGDGQLVGLELYDEVIRALEMQHSACRTGALYLGNEPQAFRPRQDSTLGTRFGADARPARSSDALPNFSENRAVTGGHENSFDDFHENSPNQPVLNQASRGKVNQGNLQRAWDVSQRASREDWDEWMRRFAIQLLREAPSPALRATASLAHAYQPLARELFSAAFVCCWDDLNEQYRANLVESLETAFVADASPEILQTLLNLAEFMEHDGVENGLPIDISILAELALKCRAYAKALHYKEREYNMGGASGSCVEALISINNKLDLPEAALGVLKAAKMQLENGRLEYASSAYMNNESSIPDRLSSQVLRHQHGYEMLYSVVSATDDVVPVGQGGPWGFSEVQESWLAKLGSWSEALAVYEEKLRQNPHDFDAILGSMRCLDASGEWQGVLTLAEKSWLAISGGWASPNEPRQEQAPHSFSSLYITPRGQRKALKFCAQAAWRLGQWEELEKYAYQLVQRTGSYALSTPGQVNNISRAQDGSLPRVDFDGAFYTAVLHIHRKEWGLAAEAIDAARMAMDSRFTALMAESYKRAYPSMVTAQTLAEMEEIVTYRKLEGRALTSAHCHPVNRPNKDEARHELLTIWRNRLAGCRVDADVHSSILAVRSLVLSPTDEVEATLTLSDLSRQAQRFRLAERVLLGPLEDLGASLNAPIFGFGVPDSLGLGLLQSDAQHAVARATLVDRLVNGDTNAFLPKYGSMHEHYSKQLVHRSGGLQRVNIQHRLYFAYVKHLWSMDEREEAMHRLGRLSDVVDLISHCEKVQDVSLRVACWLELGEWKLEQAVPLSSVIPETVQVDVLTAFKRATWTNTCGYRAWHAWALLNFRIAQQANDRDDGTTGRQRSHASSTSLRNHVVAAVKGFVNAISLGTKRWSASVQQDMLNLLTCLFKYGELSEVSSIINEGLGKITLEAWLGVLPQLLARIHIRKPSVRSVLHPLLTKLGERHPQALMYPLSVLLKSPVMERKSAAESLMNSLKAHSSALVEEALMVSSELIRVAILWLETWHAGLEDASQLYFGEGNVSGMLDLLVPLHESVERGAETSREHEFVRSFGRDLAEAHAFVKEYVRLVTRGGASIPTHGSSVAPSQNDGSETLAPISEEAYTAMNKAWDIYYTVFRRINKQLPALTKLELTQCSPALSRAHNLELGIPGSYRVDGSYVKIEHFIPSVQVIPSKQRPRKITLRGSDGKDYVFLLKGHEDLRQDERVMQLFGLVNALLARDRQTKKHDLNIQRYAISPLSHNCGVVGWVPHCDTLHSLIRDYRQVKRIPLNMEDREMLKISPDYQRLTVMQKVEVFTDGLRRTTGKGNDLYEILWLKSTNSEEWLERRTKFTRSLAVMSMVGYILGLGDRHPSNLMLDKLSGRVLHIDFGDCFEVAMNREKFPEKVPFRLTRMLVKAMEVSGIEGSYRSTSERTMTVLRESRDSLVAMLEAFVHDPLISWRLVGLSGGGVSSGQSLDLDDMNGKPAPHHPAAIDQASNMAEAFEAPVDSANRVWQDSIAEGYDEDDDEAEEIREGKAAYTGAESKSLSQRVQVGIAAQARSLSREASMSATRARSLQMYTSIQALAANVNTHSRIASIAGEGTDVVAAEGSVARSRIARSLRQRELMSLLQGETGAAHEESLNEKALKVIRRVQDKLSGTDFCEKDETSEPLDVPDQVQRLIVQATSSENLCQLFIGWCAFW